MSEPDVTDDPLDPELDRLLESERSRPELPGTGGPADRLLGRVLVTVGQLPPSGGGPSDAGNAVSGTASAASGTSGGSGAANGAAGAAISSAHPTLVAAIALVIGLVTGAAMHAALATPEIRIVEREVPVPAVEPSDPRDEADPIVADVLPSDTRDDGARAPDAEDSAGAPTSALGSTAQATRPPTRARTPDGGVSTPLSRESSLLHRAQSALARGAPELAIAALREHERLHPEGQLREERDALWISALVAGDDRDAALARAARFRERYPGSPLQPAIDASLRVP